MRPLLIASLGVLLWASSAQCAQIVLREIAVPKGSVVRLGDIAKIRATSESRAAQLAAIPLMPTPAAGVRQYIRLRQVKDMLEAVGEELFEHRFAGAARVEILRVPRVDPDTKVSPRRGTRRRLTSSLVRRIRQDVQDAILEHLSVYASATEPWQIEVTLARQQQAELADATTPLIVEGGRPPWTGPQRYTIRFSTSQGEAALNVEAMVKLPSPVVVTARAIPRGSTIRASDLVVERLDPSTRIAPNATFASKEEVVGMEVKRGLREGQPLLRAQVRAPILVRRGETVAVYARAAGVQVHTFARAREDAGRGDLVSVETLADKQRFVARVVGFREVEVYAHGIPVAAYARRAGPALPPNGARVDARPGTREPGDGHVLSQSAFVSQYARTSK